ncbi:4-hydroxy-tetrahydrodipicolinate synthase [Anaerocolumna sp. AGMB13025]|uniref:4-hydroxy-tetrahydrodipicolinate synthase n=1 Tax=Anaerocolumna sp. AGMB13025 TaxID=3039116 RepID=UPI00241F38BC|nr:4-hydroxy-tetrahydrodipicolinate synthase [Anaerocolumna sp. AGMB13025]WFR56230.1 4-hydroxy-tetrahydrodipicolinate synthase [Anaerocolumna sp. AGMB13025]
MAIFKGAGVAIVTPFKENLEVNYDKLGELLEYQIENGTDSIVICGTTGEASTLTHEEHLECIRFTVEKVNKRIPVIAGTGSNSTDTAIYLSTEARKYGADGLLLVTPYYNKATQRGLKEHFTDIAKEVDLPIILYNVPGRTGCNLLPGTVASLVKEVDNIVGIKEASGNISQVASLMHLTQGDIDLYSGNDDQIVPLLSLGGIGVISVLSNIIPKETHDIVANFLEGNVTLSREQQLKYIPLIDALFCEVNPIPVKKAMNLLGFEVGGLRKPLTEMEPENTQKLVKAMQENGLKLI